MTTSPADAPAQAVGRATVERLLITSDFARLWGASAVSSLGNVVYATTLVLWIATELAAGTTWAPLAVGALLMLRTVADIAVGPIAGVLVDRWPKRRLLVAMDLGRAAIVTALLVIAVASRGHGGPWLLGPVYLAVFIESGCEMFFMPARLGMIQEMVPADERARAIGLQRTASSTATLVGPPLAAPVLFGLGVQWGLALNAASFLISAAVQRRISTPGDPVARAADAVHGFGAELLEGLRCVAGNRVLRVLFGELAVISLASGVFGSLLVFFIIDNLHASASAYGILGAAVALGVIGGSLIVGRVVRWLGPRRSVWVGDLYMGAVVLVFSRLTRFAAALPIGVLIGVGEIFGGVVGMPLLLDETPKAMLGRVNGLMGMMTAVVITGSAFLAGALASSALAHLDATIAGVHFGTYDTIFGVAGVCVLVAAGVAWRGLGPDRTAARLPEAAPAASGPAA